MSLADAVRAAWAASPDIGAAEHAVSAAVGRARQAGAWPNPLLTYGFEQANRPGVSARQGIVSVEQRIELGTGRSTRAAAAHARQRAAEERLLGLRQQVRLETTRAYGRALAAVRRVLLLEEGSAFLARAVRVSEQRLAAGDVSGYAHRRLRLEAARYATRRAAGLLEARAAMVALSALMDPRGDSIGLAAFELTDSLPQESGTSVPLPGGDRDLVVDSLVRGALAARHDIRAAEYESQAARADAQAAAAARIPVPAFSLGLKTESVAGSATARGLVAGFSVPLPLWDRRQGEASAWASDADRKSQELIAARRRVAREVVDAYEAWQAVYVSLESLRDGLGASAATALDAIQVAWTEGEIGLIEWIDAVRAYEEAELLRIELRAEALVRRAELDWAIGEPGSATSGATTQGDER